MGFAVAGSHIGGFVSTSVPFSASLNSDARCLKPTFRKITNINDINEQLTPLKSTLFHISPTALGARCPGKETARFVSPASRKIQSLKCVGFVRAIRDVATFSLLRQKIPARGYSPAGAPRAGPGLRERPPWTSLAYREEGSSRSLLRVSPWLARCRPRRLRAARRLNGRSWARPRGCRRWVSGFRSPFFRLAFIDVRPAS